MAQPTGWEALGGLLGGIDHTTPYEEGRLHTARTEDALAQAKGRQLDNISKEAKQKARDQQESAMVAAGMDPQQAHLLGNIMTGETGSDFKAGNEGMATQQTMGFRDMVANPETPNSNRQYALAAISGKPFNPLGAIGGGGYTDITADQPTVENTPLGDAMIGTQEATTNLRNMQAGDPDLTTLSGSGGAAGGAKPPSGFIANPNYDPSKPVGEGNYAFTDARQPVMGAREATFFNRIVGGARNAQQTIENITQLPVGASAGLLGIGSKPGASMMTAGVDALRNAVSSQTVQTYNTMVAGLDANLAQIEGHGLATSDSFRGQYDRLALREGDTELTRLHKLAEMAQTIESGLEPYLNNPRVPQQQKEYMASLIAKVRKTIPFTHADVQALEQNKERTLADVMAARGLMGETTPAGGAEPVAGTAPAAGPRQPPLKNAKGWDLLIDAEGNMAYVSPTLGPDGQPQYEEVTQ